LFRLEHSGQSQACRLWRRVPRGTLSRG